MTNRRGRPVVAAAMTMLAFAVAADAGTWEPHGPWRIGEARAAPWARADAPAGAALRGAEVRFESARVVAPPPIACDGARYEWRFPGPDGLFEGGLPEPRAQAARGLGLTGDRIATLRVTCDNAGFDFHRTARGDLLLGLDNVIWTLQRIAPPDSATSRVEELLLTHFTHDMGFTSANVVRKQAFLSARLRRRITAWFAASRPADEAPAIDGDPFTDSQEYPDRFTLEESKVDGARAVVRVQFADGHSTRRLDYEMVREDAQWRLDDIIDGRGGSLMETLR